MSTEKLIPESPDKWRVTAGTKQDLLDCKRKLQKALSLRKMTQEDFAREIADNWTAIMKAILDKKKV